MPPIKTAFRGLSVARKGTYSPPYFKSTSSWQSGYFLLYDCTLGMKPSEIVVSLGWLRRDPFVRPAASTPYLRVPAFPASLIAILPCQVSSIGTIITHDRPCLSRTGPVQDETDRESRARYDREQNTLQSDCNQLRKISPDDRPVGVSIVIQRRPVQS